MPKLIDYPRTNYTGAWELAEVVDDTGGKCAIDTAARKLNRKVSGSFKAIIGSAVKFGLMTSKRELLSTTTLFKRIKHAYDKLEELQFHREAFLTPPLFTQICRKFRGRELPIQMLDVMLIREFGVEEINAQSVAKAFVEGCRMCSLLDDHNIMADIDAMSAQRTTRRELASPTPATNNFIQRSNSPTVTETSGTDVNSLYELLKSNTAGSQINSSTKTDASNEPSEQTQHQTPNRQTINGPDAITTLFGINPENEEQFPRTIDLSVAATEHQTHAPIFTHEEAKQTFTSTGFKENATSQNPPSITTGYQISITGPGVNTSLDVTHEEDISIAVALLEKIRRQLRTA